jgi:hypothetical protein
MGEARGAGGITFDGICHGCFSICCPVMSLWEKKMMMNGSWPKSLRERNFRAAKKLAVQQKAIINRSRGRPDVPTSWSRLL